MGSSGGALVGGMHKAGISVNDVAEIMFETDFTKFANISRWQVALMILLCRDYLNNGEKLEKKLDQYLQGMTMDETEDLWIVTTDMCNGKVKIFDKSDVGFPVARAIRASVSIPVVWNPVKYKDGELYDGGIRYNFPVDFFDEDKGIPVVGVRMTQKFSGVKKSGIVQKIKSIAHNMIDAQEDETTEDSKAELIVELEDFGIGSTDFDISREQKTDLMVQSYSTMQDALEQLD